MRIEGVASRFPTHMEDNAGREERDEFICDEFTCLAAWGCVYEAFG